MLCIQLPIVLVTWGVIFKESAAQKEATLAPNSLASPVQRMAGTSPVLSLESLCTSMWGELNLTICYMLTFSLCQQLSEVNVPFQLNTLYVCSKHNDPAA
jgi:hypothetical protein